MVVILVLESKLLCFRVSVLSGTRLIFKECDDYKNRSTLVVMFLFQYQEIKTSELGQEPLSESELKANDELSELTPPKKV